MPESPTNENLAGLSADELAQREAQARADLDAILDLPREQVTAEHAAQATQLRDAIRAVRAESESRAAAQDALLAQLDEIRESVTPAADTPAPAGNDGGGEGGGGGAAETPAVADTAAPAETTAPAAMDVTPIGEAIAASLAPLVTALTQAQHYSPATTRPAAENAPKLNPSLADASRHAPRVDAPDTPRSVIVAGAHVPGVEVGSRFESKRDIATAMAARAATLSDAAGTGWENRRALATIRRQFEHTLPGQGSTREQVDRALTAAVARGSDMAALVAAGGWCAPSQRTYDLFNIADVDGLIDLPTIGIERGGIEWPVSPSFADVASSTGLWRWTETQDIAAATGTAQSGTKTCARVPCPTHTSARLDCDGMCVTAGNLMTDAYPEVIENYIDLLGSAHEHKLNSLKIQTLVAGSTSVTYTATGGGLVAPVLGAIEQQAVDYRAKYRMNRTAVLEAILPDWLRAAMRSDLRRRTGISVEAFADAYLMSLLDGLNVRAQWVFDYQIGSYGLSGSGASTPATAWPATVQFLLYAPGTWFVGEGLTLDLGVVRDSTLNATNDYTALWREQCWLMGKRGHESRAVTVPICPNGITGAASWTACTV